MDRHQVEDVAELAPSGGGHDLVHRRSTGWRTYPKISSGTVGKNRWSLSATHSRGRACRIRQRLADTDLQDRRVLSQRYNIEAPGIYRSCEAAGYVGRWAARSSSSVRARHPIGHRYTTSGWASMPVRYRSLGSPAPSWRQDQGVYSVALMGMPGSFRPRKCHISSPARFPLPSASFVGFLASNRVKVPLITGPRTAPTL